MYSVKGISQLYIKLLIKVLVRIIDNIGENVAIKVIELASIKSSKLEELLTS